MTMGRPEAPRPPPRAWLIQQAPIDGHYRQALSSADCRCGIAKGMLTPMPGTPQDWNVVINGAWNLAILTPKGIARRLLELPEGTPVEVQVSVDQPGAIRIAHEGTIITPSIGRLFVEPSGEFTVSTLGRAATIAQRALQSLPETPVTAAGVNIKYRFEALSDVALNLIASPLDDLLADADYTIAGRHLRRSVQWEGGLLNIEIDEKSDTSGIISFNFHCASADPQVLRDWLGKVAEMIPIVDTLMNTITTGNG